MAKTYFLFSLRSLAWDSVPKLTTRISLFQEDSATVEPAGIRIQASDEKINSLYS